MEHFRKIEAGVDVRPLMEELDHDPTLWNLQTGRQAKVPVQSESVTIPLRGLRRSRLRGRPRRDVHESRYTTLSLRLPRAVEYLETIAARLKGELSRAKIVNLSPGARVLEHRDRGEYYAVRDRFHLVLRSGDDGSLLRSAHEEARLRPGELWWFDNNQVHSAHNDGDVDRIHLIFDLLIRKA